MAERSYGQRCSVAHALDLIGERWALLLVRELLLGPKRFTELRTGLAPASPNVLSQRLHELQHAAVVRRYQLPPPARSWVYELTDWGRRLEPVVVGLARWGARSPWLPATGELRADSAVLGLLAFFDRADDREWQALCNLHLGEDRFTARVTDGQLQVEHGQASNPDAVIEASAQTFGRVLGRPRELADALRGGELTITGDARIAQRLLQAVSTPAPATATKLPPVTPRGPHE